MKDLRSELAKIINLFSPGEGLHESPLSGTYCIKVSQPGPRTKRRWGAALCIIVQGSKEIILGREIYRCDEAHYIATPIDLPVTNRVFSAMPEKPFLCLKIDFDPLILSEVAAQLEKGFPKEMENSLPAVFIGKAGDRMLDAAIRLGKLFRTPEDAPVLGPLVIKEILYHLLNGADGPAIRQFVRSGSNMHKIFQAIYSLRSELDDDVDVAALSKAANMSRSAFFKHFKEATAMSPIQYQKRLRLLEARRLMTDEGETAEGSAFKVGYNSASQFSREYSRMFGNPPLRDTVKIKKTGHPIHQM
ncbi:MAG TPA: AraC family transcriptional regulator [Opitutaceae bacterium]|nr:AraC family transcriptional regulator [Opitutaceae bacterium]